jgi:hypothetical protein
MPQSLNIGAFVFGAVLVLLSLVVGKFKLFGAEVDGTVGKVGRVIAFLFGVFLISTGLNFNNDHKSNPEPEPSSLNTPPINTQPRPPQVTPSVIRKPKLTQEFEDYMSGTWQFRTTVPSTRIVSTYDMEFLRNGNFSGTRSVNNFLQDTFSGTWIVLPSSSDSFTLTLNDLGGDPKSLILRVIDRDSVEDANNGTRWSRK